MPIYEYTCPACGASFEKIQRAWTDGYPCPRCGTEAQRIVSRPAATSGAAGTAPATRCGGRGFS